MKLINLKKPQTLTINLLFLSFTLLFAAPAYQRTPVIGIISSPGKDPNDPISAIKTTYPEFVEAGGAKVIPIPWDIDEQKFKTLLESVNGVLFTGGPALLWAEDPITGKRTYSAFQKRLNYVVDLVKKKKTQGVHYPLWAICQGFEAVGIALTGDLFILDNYVHFGKLSEVYFTPEASSSTMFQYFTQDSFNIMENNPTMYYYHEYGLNTSVPTIYPAFSEDKWTVTGTSKDDNGKEFLTAMESKEYPIYMAMFHAETVLFEAVHSPKARHLSGAIYAIKLMANSFITEALKNNNHFENEDLLEELMIENFGIVDWGSSGLFYAFDKYSLDEKWEKGYPASNGNGIIVFLLVAILVGGAFFGYSKYKQQQQQKKIDAPYMQFPDHLAIEMKQQNQNDVSRGP